MGRKPISKHRSKNEVKRERWINLCMQYFAEKGISDVTMEDVAQILNVSKATIYNHFKSKDEMVMTAIEIRLRDIAIYEEYFKDESLSFFDRYYEGMKYYAIKMGAVSTTLVRDVKNLYPALWKTVEAFRDRFNQVAMEYYLEGIKKGFFHPELNLKILVATDRWFLESLIERNFLLQSEMTVEEALNGFFEMKFEGIVKWKIQNFRPKKTE